MIWQQLGGAVKRAPRDATAFYHRDAEFDFVVLSLWPDSAADERNIRWTRDLRDATAPYGSGGVYVNNLGDDPQDRVRAAYGDALLACDAAGRGGRRARVCCGDRNRQRVTARVQAVVGNNEVVRYRLVSSVRATARCLAIAIILSDPLRY